MPAPDPGAARLYMGLRFTSWRFLAGPSHNEGMRTIIAALAALGGGVILAACAVSVAHGDSSEVDWFLVGPLPFLVIGLVGFLRQPGNRVVWWLIGVGVAFGCDTALGDVFLPMAENHWGDTSSITAAIALLDHWFAVAAPVAGVGLVGFFPSGRPERAYERVVIWTLVLAGFLLPLLEAVGEASIAPAGGPPDDVPAVLYRALFVPALVPLGEAAEAVYRTFPLWSLIGVVLLALRYRRTEGARRRQIRWLLLGIAVSFSLWVPPVLLWQLADPDNAAAAAVTAVLFPLALAAIVGWLLVALFYTGVFGIDEPARRAFVRRVLRVSIAVVLAALAVLAGALTSLAAPTLVAVAVAVAAGAAGQTVRRRLEHAADRWVLGARLAGYASLSRFGESLTRAPGSADLLRDLAGEIRRGLELTWTRVSVEAPGGQPRVVTDGTPAADPAATVPVEYRGTILGRIECGPRTDGPLLAEDRRLLAYFAVQAAVGVHNLYLAAELSQRVEEIRDQAAELAASRDRVVAGQDAERRRIQRVLHDGVQQEIVALSARAGLVRQQLLRGDPAAAEALADMQRDLAVTLQDVREIAYAIHPPVLSDRGLLEAIEAQSSRLAVPMAVRADPRLRGVRFGEQIEVTAWYVLAEALSNVVKHAGASEVEVSLSQQDGRLGLVIRDDGCGFDPGRPRGLGLTGLSDRLNTVGGSLTINSDAGLGTSVCVHIPVVRDTESGPGPVAGRERADA
jgi:signal transduction histidine kinase